MVDIALKWMNAFSDASGLSLNIKKCVLLPIHSWPESSIASINVQTEVKYLGLTISKDVRRIEEVNIEKRVVTVWPEISQYLEELFYLKLKVIYPCHSLFIYDNNIRKANSVHFQFIWRNKTHYLNRSQLVKEYNNSLRFWSLDRLI